MLRTIYGKLSRNKACFASDLAFKKKNHTDPPIIVRCFMLYSQYGIDPEGHFPSFAVGFWVHQIARIRRLIKVIHFQHFPTKKSWFLLGIFCGTMPWDFGISSPVGMPQHVDFEIPRFRKPPFVDDFQTKGEYRWMMFGYPDIGQWTIHGFWRSFGSRFASTVPCLPLFRRVFRAPFIWKLVGSHQSLVVRGHAIMWTVMLCQNFHSTLYTMVFVAADAQMFGDKTKAASWLHLTSKPFCLLIFSPYVFSLHHIYWVRFIQAAWTPEFYGSFSGNITFQIIGFWWIWMDFDGFWVLSPSVQTSKAMSPSSSDASSSSGSSCVLEVNGTLTNLAYDQHRSVPADRCWVRRKIFPGTAMFV